MRILDWHGFSFNMFQRKKYTKTKVSCGRSSIFTEPNASLLQIDIEINHNGVDVYMVLTCTSEFKEP